MEINTEIKQGESFGVIESIKSVSDLYSPLSGKIIEINDDMKIGTNMHDYIVSQSGIYRLGVMYQVALSKLQVVP